MSMYGPFTEYLEPHRNRLAVGLLAAFIAQATAAAVPLLIKQAINAIDLSIPLPDQDESLITVQACAIGMVALSAIVAAGRYGMRWLLGSASNRIEYDIRAAYFSHLLLQPLSYYQTRHTGDLMARATNDLNSVHIFFTYCVRSIAEAVLIFAFSVTMMCFIDWRLSLIVIAPLPLLGFLILRMSALVHGRFRRIQDFFGEMSDFVQENVAGIRVIKAYVQGSAQIKTFDTLNREYLERNQKLIQTRAVYYPLFFLMSSIGLGLVLWFGGSGVINGQLDIGEFVAFNTYLTMLIRHVSFIGWLIDRTQRAIVAMRRINEVLAVEPEIRDRARAASFPPITGHIRFQELHFAYGDSPVLRGINLDIPSGTTVGILGRVGSGKTTLTRLIPRLIEAPPNSILVDGKPVEEWPLEALRHSIGYVSQSPFLFSDTLSANIAYGLENASLAHIRTAAEEAQIRTEIEEFEAGFSTIIGERGVTLSGGQKQRSTLARALIRRPAILILDDALSAVDTHTEEEILQHLRRLMFRRTTLLVAHRISTVRHADQIIVLNDGRIGESGTHSELLDHGGFYAELHHRQQLSAELEAL